MREFLRGLEFDDETVDTIMAEYGKLVTKDKEELQTLKGEIASLKESSGGNWKEKYEELDRQIKDQEAEKKAKEEDDILNKNINEVFGDKKFINDYTKNAVVSEIKVALKDKNNAGKSIKDLFESITKDKNDLFQNPNQLKDMPSIKDMSGSVSKEDFNKMGYNERIEFKKANPELFREYNK
jgi:hypothetical protein